MYIPNNFSSATKTQTRYETQERAIFTIATWKAWERETESTAKFWDLNQCMSVHECVWVNMRGTFTPFCQHTLQRAHQATASTLYFISTRETMYRWYARALNAWCMDVITPAHCALSVHTYAHICTSNVHAYACCNAQLDICTIRTFECHLRP